MSLVEVLTLTSSVVSLILLILILRKDSKQNYVAEGVGAGRNIPLWKIPKNQNSC